MATVIYCTNNAHGSMYVLAWPTHFTLPRQKCSPPPSRWGRGSIYCCTLVAPVKMSPFVPDAAGRCAMRRGLCCALQRLPGHAALQEHSRAENSVIRGLVVSGRENLVIRGPVEASAEKLGKGYLFSCRDLPFATGPACFVLKAEGWQR